MEDTEGNALGAVTPLDALANVHRRRRQPQPSEAPSLNVADTEVELAYRDDYGHTGEDD
ncbi:hypothetical protein G3480_27150 [Thiorhodococcus mannitoliphagus]|uniref:Uncharacterized protein n=1 Tax=Thiorhodococcus mannitoliphagus TaxID=329406 RepID=A0A6P1E3G8_9GAMM|nr:hypothetical protein [Thiorhodococcus mannitoliphagus]